MPKYKKSIKKIKNKQAAKALIKHNFNKKRAYKELHPDCKDSSAQSNANRMINDDVIDEITKSLTKNLPDDSIISPKFIRQKLLQMLDNTKDEGIAIRILENLAKILGMKQDKQEIIYTPKEKDELDSKIKDMLGE